MASFYPLMFGPSKLPTHLWNAASPIFEAAKEAKVLAVLFGGAAGLLNGSLRSTKDLDIEADNLRLTDYLPGDRFLIRRRSSEQQMKVTFVARGFQNVRCDVGAKRAELINATRDWHKTTDGISFANEKLLLLDKIRVLGARLGGKPSDSKRMKDLNDIDTMTEKIYWDLDVNGLIEADLLDLAWGYDRSRSKVQIVQDFLRIATDYPHILENCRHLFPKIGLHEIIQNFGQKRQWNDEID